MLTPDKILMVKRAIYEDTNLINEIANAVTDSVAIVVESINTSTDGVHITYKLTEQQRYIGGPEMMMTEASLRADIARAIEQQLGTRFPYLQGLLDTFKLVNVLKVSKDTFVAII